MDVATAEPEQRLYQLDDELRRACARRNLRIAVLRGEDGRLLIVISNRTSAAAYRAEAGWAEKLRLNLDSGMFG